MYIFSPDVVNVVCLLALLSTVYRLGKFYINIFAIKISSKISSVVICDYFFFFTYV